MIVDTSALIAVFRREDGYLPLREGLLQGSAILPAVVIVEFFRVLMQKRENLAAAQEFFDELMLGAEAIDFTIAHGREAAAANPVHGSGNMKGGKLNLLDLMVYAAAKQRELPILCTGRDFASTGIAIHPASRPV